MLIPKLVRIAAGSIIITSMAATGGCAAVKPYQKAWLNDFSMKLGKTDIEKFDESVHTYREGASGGGNGKASGGCGCN